MRYRVIVGNIGTVEETDNPIEANKTYGDYKRQSIGGIGRAGGESVVLMDGDDIKYEHCGDINDE